jgi:aspartyl-tRNA(Asn)/glutamyl-tRNA(Gln) amidotransferase subunit B
MLWDEARGVTEPMRSKEFAHDYRYFPEPDLVPILIDAAWRQRVQESLPELPQARRSRFVAQYGLPEYDAGVLTAAKATADFFEKTTALYDKPKPVGNWIMGDFAALLNEDNREIQDSPVTPELLAEMLTLMDDGTISGKIAKTVFAEMYQTGKSARQIVAERGLTQISDTSALEAIVAEVLAENLDAVEKYKAGNAKLFAFLVGQVMKKSQGKANPQLANQMLRERLK